MFLILLLIIISCKGFYLKNNFLSRGYLKNKNYLSNNEYYNILNSDLSLIGLENKNLSLLEENIKKIENNNEYQNFINNYENEYTNFKTCNRYEIYYLGNNTFNNKILNILINKCNINENNIYYYKNNECIEYLFNTSAGFNSKIFGENEILSQLKEKHIKLKETNNKYLTKLFEHALNNGKEIKTKTNISKKHISISSLTYDLIKNISNNHNTKLSLNLSLVGSGKIVRSILKILQKDNYSFIKKINIINHNLESAIVLKKEFLTYKINIYTLNNCEDILNDSDIIITATSSNKFLLDKNSIKNRKYKYLIDLSLPKNINPNIKDLLNIKLYDLENINENKNINIKSREKELNNSLMYIKKNIIKFNRWNFLYHYNKKLSELKVNIDLTKEKKNLLEKKNLTDNDLDLYNKRIINKIIHNLYKK
jgi:glutamyl-tRNA reductase